MLRTLIPPPHTHTHSQTSAQGIFAHDPSTWSVASSVINNGNGTSHVHNVTEFKFAARMTVREYFDSKDGAEVARRCVREEAGWGGQHLNARVGILIARTGQRWHAGVCVRGLAGEGST